MRAVRMHELDAPLVEEEIAEPEAGPGWCVIRVRAVAICASDLHFLSGHSPTGPLPLTLGHEIAGTVEAIGHGVEGVRLGDRVFVNPLIGCGGCGYCSRGEPNFCARRRLLGVHVDGGMAEFVAAPAENLTVLPIFVPFEQAAMIESAGTANHALRLIGDLEGQPVAVIGAGGVGLQAVRLAAARGAEVIAIDPDPVARGRAVAAGAVAALDPADDVRRRIRADHEEGLAGVVDSVGFPSTLDLASDLLRNAGVCAVSGIGVERLRLAPPARFVRSGLRIAGVYAYTPRDIAAVAERLTSGAVDFASSISATFRLSEVNDAIAAFAARQGSPVRFVLTTD